MRQFEKPWKSIIVPLCKDGLRRIHIFEPLFAIAAAADAERGITMHVDEMMKAVQALSGIRIEDDSHEAGLVAALTAREGICEPNGRGIVISAGSALSLFRETQSLDWVDSYGKGARPSAPRRLPLGDPPPRAILDQRATGPGKGNSQGL
jgi:hypothetical protein